MGAVKAAIADGVYTGLWILCVSTLAPITATLSTALELKGVGPSLCLTILILTCMLFVFTIIGNLMGGASFNPTGSACFYAAGFGGDSLLSLAFRLPAQVLGAAAGALAAVQFMPPEFKHMLEGPSLKVDVHTGAIAEGVLTFVISFLVLWIILRGPRNPLVNTFLLATATIGVVIAGSGYTGPSMNPANAFAWAYIRNQHNTWEQFYVYWICPFVGSILAAWVFRFIFPPPPAMKQKKA